MCAVSPEQCVAKPCLIPPVPLRVRNDEDGHGHFGASRDGGTRGHRGLDLVAADGEPVMAPCNGGIGDRGQCYRDTDEYRYVRIQTWWAEVRVLYVKPCVDVGDQVKAGQLIGYAQNVAKRYGPLMTNHIHLELRVIRGVLLGIEGWRPEDVVTMDPMWFLG